MPGVGVTGDDRQHQLLPAGTDPDGRVRSLDGFRVIARSCQLVVPSLEGGTVLRHQQADDLHALLQSFGPLLERWEGDPQLLVFRLVPGGAQAELEPAAGDVGDGDRLGRQDRWVAVSDAGYQRPEAEPRGERRQARQEGPRLQAGTVPVAVQRREVVEYPGPVESRGLRELHPFRQFGPEKLVLRDI